jgi:hypothetical protein
MSGFESATRSKADIDQAAHTRFMRNKLWLDVLGKESPATGGPDAGLRTTSLASTSVVEAVWPWRCRLGGAQILSGGLAGSAVRDHVEGDLLPFVERAQARAFDRADVHEDILAAGFRLNETEALLIVKPLHGSLVHGSPSCRYVWR